ncbi:hypothetical protein GCM10009087_41290 [Sphingomonas oligophenolica]
MGFLASLWQCVGNVLGLIGVLTVIWFQAGLPWLVAAYAGMPVAAAALNSAIFFTRVRPDLTPRRSAFSRERGAELARLGGSFFVLQVVAAVAYGADNIVIAQKLGATAVASYSIPDRLFAMASLVVGFAVAPLWPAFGEALARGESGWARLTVVRATLSATAISAAICLVFLAGGPFLIHLWVGKAIDPPFTLLIGLAFWRISEAAFGAPMMYLNGAQEIRFQVITGVFIAVSALTLKIVLIERLGVSILPFIMAACSWSFFGIPAWVKMQRHFASFPAATETNA